MTDGVSDEQFEEALTQAREEGNLSRANVARKAKSKARKESVDADDSLTDATGPKPSDDMPSRPTPDKAANQFKKNSTEMVETINHMLQQGQGRACPKERALDLGRAICRYSVFSP